MIEEDALFGEVGHQNAPPNRVSDEASRRSAEWDLKQAPRNYLALVSAQVIAASLSLTSVWLATHYLGPSGYGGVVAFIAAAQVVMLVAVNWTSISVARFGCEEFVSDGRIAATFWTRLIVLIPNLILVLVAAPLWLPIVTRILSLPPTSTWLVLSLLVVNAWWIHIQQALQGAKLIRLQGWLLAVERILIFLALCYLAFSGTISVSKVGWLYVFGPAGASVIGLVRLTKLIWPVSVDLILLRRLLRFSVPLIPTALMGYLQTNYLDALFITHFLSQAKLGIYAVAYQLAGLTQQLPLLAGMLLMPLFVTLQSGKQEERTERYIRAVLPPVTLLWTIACALLAAAGAWLVPMIFGERFDEAGILLWPLMAASALAGPTLMGYTPVTTSIAKTHIQMIAVGLSSCVNVLLDVLLIPRYGLLGCAWATAATYGTHLTVMFLLIHWRVMPKPTWTLAATFPIVVGALYASLFSANGVALGLTLGVSALVAFANWRSLVFAFKTLRSYSHLAPYPGGSIVAAADAHKV